MIDLTRRDFMKGCCATVAAYAGSRLGLAFAADAQGRNDDLLVVVFLRGGMDGLSLLPPIDGPQRAAYEAFRPSLRVPTTGPDAALALTAEFGLNPAAASLAPLYQAGHVAFVQGVGLPDSSRSHFDAMAYLELGTPGVKSTTTGWLTRHLESAGNLLDQVPLPAVSAGSLPASSLAGTLQTLTVSGAGAFSLDDGAYQDRDALRIAMRRLWEVADTPLHQAGRRALNAVDLVERYVGGDYTAANGAVYPTDAFGQQLETIARLAKLDLGLRVATIDLGGWDTHESQGDGGRGTFGELVRTLADGLVALYTDLDTSQANAPAQRLTVVTMSEFGRRVRENADHGTDHGTGNVSLLVGGAVTGGVHGVFPGLGEGQLFDGADLAVTTDMRRVLAEILLRRLGNPRLSTVFPRYTGHVPLGVVAGADLTPI